MVKKHLAPAGETHEAATVEQFLTAHFGADSRRRISQPERALIERIASYVADHFTGKGDGRRRKYVLGLALSFLLLAEKLRRPPDREGGDEFSPTLTKSGLFKQYPPYNRIADLFMHELERSSFPYAPGDATNKWQRHEELLVDCFRLSAAGRRIACKRLIQFGLEKLPRNPTFRQPLPRPRVFSAIVQSYERSDPDEEAGATYHSIAYGYLAADRPHLQLITDRSRSSSKRQQRIGDIDCYYGADLELAVEVKDLQIDKQNLNQQLGSFMGQIKSRGVFGLVTVKSIAPEAAADLKAHGVLALSEDQLQQHVRLWDWRKEEIAFAGMLHYLSHIEQRPEAVRRLLRFIERQNPQHDSLRYLRRQ